MPSDPTLSSLRFYLSGSPLALIEWSPDHRCVQWNSQAEQVFGWTAEEVIGHRWDAFNIVHPDDAAAVEDLTRRIFQGETATVVNQNRNLTKSGRVIVCEWYNAVRRDTDGGITGLVTLVQDVTEREMDRRRLYDRERDLRITQRLAAIGTWHRDLTTGAREWSSGMYPLFGAAPADGPLPQDAVLAMHTPDSAARLAEALDRVRVDGRVRELDLALTMPDGTPAFHQAIIEGVQNRAGRVTLIRGTVQDVTERRKLEAESRARELAQLARLVTVGEMSAAIAHEVNQPLAAIAMLAKAIEPASPDQPVDAEELADVLRMIGEEALRAGKVVHRVKDMARHREPVCEALDLRDVLDEAVAIVEPTVRHRGCRLRWDRPDTAMPVWTDAGAVKQVLVNLVLNAVDAMADTGPERVRVVIAAGPAGEAGDAWRVGVTDQGVGVPAEDLHRVFHPFVTTKPDGLGLGLSICANLVEAHHGRIWAEPADPHGVTFFATWPRADGDGPAGHSAEC